MLVFVNKTHLQMLFILLQILFTLTFRKLRTKTCGYSNHKKNWPCYKYINYNTGLDFLFLNNALSFWKNIWQILKNITIHK